MNVFLRKSISVLLILSSLMSSAALAEKVLVMSDAAVYTSVGDSASEIGTLSAGTVLTRKASHNGWAMVTMNGKTAYMKDDALAVPKACKKIAYAKEETVLYKSFSTDSKKVAAVEAGAQLKVAGVAGDWAYAMVDGQTGFVLTSALTLDAPKQESASSDSSAIETMSITAYAATDGAKVYSTSGKKLGQVALNTSVTVKAIRDNLCLVERDGVTAVMYKSDLSTEKTEEKVEEQPEETPESNITTISPTTFYAKADGAKVYAASGEVIATLTKNFAVTVSAYSGDYAYVTCDGNSGVMHKDDLTTEKVQEAEETPTTLGYGSTGEAVEKVQARLKELGYFGGTVGGNYLDLTQSAVKAFQKAAGLSETGEVDAKTLSAMFSDDAPKYEAQITNGSSAVPATGTAVEMDWWTSDIQTIFSRGTTATITDVATGIAWNETRTGGTNHADVQPTTAADTAAMKKAVGSWSWTRRAIFVTINGKNYAASMNCMPHGSGSTISNNNFNGHHCIHFTNSRTHGTNKVCSLHQNAIKKAAQATL